MVSSRRTVVITIALACTVLCAFGQVSPPTTSIPVPAVPTEVTQAMSFSVAGGLGYGQGSEAPVGWGSFGTSADGVNWVFLCPTLTAKTTSMEAYYGRTLYHKGGIEIMSLIGAGGSTGTAGTAQQNVAASYGAGGAISVDASKFTHIANTSFVAAYKFQHSNISDPTNPNASWGTSNLYFGFGWKSQ